MSQKQARGFVIAAPHSGAGKTLVTLGLLRALTKRGLAVSSAKVGPDFIDPAFHSRACGNDCINLDLWAMGDERISAEASMLAVDKDILVVEGVMGLFDGADNGFGSTADVATSLDLPVIFIVDARAQSWSVAALLHGFSTFRPDVNVAGVIFNRVASERHQSLLKRATAPLDIPVLGCLPRLEDLSIPSRHLGLVQAVEHAGLEDFIEKAACLMADHIDLDQLMDASKIVPSANGLHQALAPLGQSIAVARDEAFAFAYPHMVRYWQTSGAEIVPFSPLNNEAPDAKCDAVFLPGGYPELHAGKLATNENFLRGLKRAADKEALIYGECGGFMVLGENLIDKDGISHAMAGLLPVTTSFAKPKRQLGYRCLSHASPLPWASRLMGHEFHYSTELSEHSATPLFQARDANGVSVPDMGCQIGKVLGSYAHVISARSESGGVA